MLIQRALEFLGLSPIFGRGLPGTDPQDRRHPWGKGTGRASYVVVQRRRAANRRARVSRRINRRRSK